MSSSFFVSLRSKVQNLLTPWRLSDPLFQRVRVPLAQKSHHHECEVLPSDPEWDFVKGYFFQYAPLTYSIKRIFCVHKPSQIEQFEASLVTMDGEAQNPFFAPRWVEKDPTGCRTKVMARWRESAHAFSPVAVERADSRKEVLSHVFVFPYWHGSNQEKVQSICDTGFAYFGKHDYKEDKKDKGPSTDIGFFGSGIYFTNSARYAADIYSSGHLLLAWVSMRSPYPVIEEEEDAGRPLDREKLQALPAFENYDAHYIPVIAVNTSNPMCTTYVPCRKDQIPMWDETVVFNKSQTLPRFYVELMVTLPTTPISPVAMLTQLLEDLQQLSNKPEIAENPQLLSLFQQKKQLLFVIGDSSHISSVDQKFFDLVRQLQIGAAKLDEHVIRQLLIPSPLPAPAVKQPFPEPPATFLPPPSTFLPSPFDIPPMLEGSVPDEEVLEASGMKKEKDLASLDPLFRKVLAWRWIHDSGEKWEIPCLDFDKSTSVLLLENGQMVTGDGRSVSVWDSFSGKCLRLFKKESCHSRKVLSLGEERLLFLMNSQELVIWDVRADKVLQRFCLPHHDSHWINDFILLKNGCIAACADQTICLWNSLTGECQETFNVNVKSIHDLRLFSMEKDYLVIVDFNSLSPYLIIWSLNEKKYIFSKKYFSGFCLSDEEVVYWEKGGSFFVFNPFSVEQRDKPKQLAGHKGDILCCCRLKDGHIISGSEDKTLKIWDTQSGQCVKTLESRTPVDKILELKNGWIVSGAWRGSVGVWDLQSGKLLQEFFFKGVESIEEIGEGKILVVFKSRTTIFDLTRGERVSTFPGKGRCLKEGFILCYSGDALQTIDPTSGCVLQSFSSFIVSTPIAPYQLPDGRKLVITDTFKGSIFLEEGRGVFQCVAQHIGLEPLLFLKEGLVLGEKNGNFQVVNPKNYEVLNAFPCCRGREYKKLISAPNGKFIALSEEQIDIWDRKQDRIIKSLHPRGKSGPFLLSENIRFLAQGVGESFQVFLEKSELLKARCFRYKVVELQNGGIAGVSEDWKVLKVWDAKGGCLRVLKGHETTISFVIELHGNRLIGGSEDGVLKIWDLQSGNVLCTLNGHESEITAICELKDGLIASADRKGGLTVWSSEGAPFYGFRLSSHISSILSLKDGRFATFSVDGKYRIWNPKDGKCEQLVETYLEGSFYLAQCKDDNLFIFEEREWGPYERVIFDLKEGKALGRPLMAQGSFRISKEKMVGFFNGGIFLWDLASGKCIRRMQGPSGIFGMGRLLQNGSFLIVFVDENDDRGPVTLQKWEQNGEGCVKTWNRDMVDFLQLQDGRVVMGFVEGILEVWSSDMEECLSTWDGYSGNHLLQLENGALIELGHEGVEWNVKTGQLVCSSVDFDWIRYKDGIRDFECLYGSNLGLYKILDLSKESDLQWVLENDVLQLQVGIDLPEGFLVCENSHLRILDPKTNLPLKSFGDEEMGSKRVVIPLEDGSLATTNLMGKKINVRDLHTGKHLRVVDLPPPDFSRQKEPPTITWFCALEKVLPNRVSSSILKIWNSLSETYKTFFRNPDYNFLSMTQLEDGSFALSHMKSIEIWNKEANKRLETLGGSLLPEGILLLQDGSILNWLKENPTIRIWNPADGKMVQVLRGNSDSVTCAIQLRGGLVASGSEDTTLKIWDLKSGNCLQTLQGHHGAVTSVLQLSENTLLSGSKDETLKIWNLAAGECLKTISCKGPVLSLCQLQDGRILSKRGSCKTNAIFCS